MLLEAITHTGSTRATTPRYGHLRCPRHNQAPELGRHNRQNVGGHGSSDRRYPIGGGRRGADGATIAPFGNRMTAHAPLTARKRRREE